VVERQLLDSLVEFLDEHDVDTSEMRQRESTILNNGVMMTGGSFRPTTSRSRTGAGAARRHGAEAAQASSRRDAAERGHRPARRVDHRRRRWRSGAAHARSGASTRRRRPSATGTTRRALREIPALLVEHADELEQPEDLLRRGHGRRGARPARAESPDPVVSRSRDRERGVRA
jgi:hypothetical protein